MEISFTELKEKEIINIHDGRKLGRITDVLFDHLNGEVKGVVVPGERKLFHRSEDLFIPLSKIKRIGDDVILVSIGQGFMKNNYAEKNQIESQQRGNFVSAQNVNYVDWNRRKLNNNKNNMEQSSYLRFRPLDNKKYK